MRPGTQVVYIPLHAQDRKIDLMPGAALPRGVEAGFVTGDRLVEGAVFVRYWRIHKNGQVEHVLRTTANSESTLIDDLVFFDMVPQELVDSEMLRLGYDAEGNQDG